MKVPALLALEEGSLFYGQAIGALGTMTGEVVFNTSMTGYQEILSDPSYCGQMVTLTYPHIGNVGVNDEDNESSKVWAAGLIVRDFSTYPSNWRKTGNCDTYLQQHNTVGIAEIDTRALTHLLREKGALKGCIMSGAEIDADVAVANARACQDLKGQDLAKRVTTPKAYDFTDNIEPIWQDKQIQPLKSHVVVAYDFGAKRAILKQLVARGCIVRVVPATTPPEQVIKMQPDGIFLSNGPGDPEPCDYAIKAIRSFLDKNIPLFGVCLGHQLLALACGAHSEKMKFGHHGANHPVKDLATEQVLITSQNHSFTVAQAIPKSLTVTHRSLFDGSIQGLAHVDKPAFSFQGHPEASPGPHDAMGLFDKFIRMMDDEHLKKTRKKGSVDNSLGAVGAIRQVKV